ncbi:MAG: hypothetical protein KGJ87_07645 [Planctomycetota bacterium]|nr:hypothetical protein [Planctomycetota bacterium]MDE2217012.1 hypothetical protein [Planctomycetota bacterium]
MAARSEAEAIHGFLPEAPAFRLGSGSLPHNLYLLIRLFGGVRCEPQDRFIIKVTRIVLIDL